MTSSRNRKTSPPPLAVNEECLLDSRTSLCVYAGKGLVQRAGNAAEASAIMGHDDGGEMLMETLKAYTATANGERTDDFGKTVFPSKNFAAEEEFCEWRLRSGRVKASHHTLRPSLTRRCHCQQKSSLFLVAMQVYPCVVRLLGVGHTLAQAVPNLACIVVTM